MPNKSHGYRYVFEKTVWYGEGFSSVEEAQKRFDKIINDSIMVKIASSTKWWKFWEKRVELPCIFKHTF